MRRNTAFALSVPLLLAACALCLPGRFAAQDRSDRAMKRTSFAEELSSSVGAASLIHDARSIIELPRYAAS